MLRRRESPRRDLRLRLCHDDDGKSNSDRYSKTGNGSKDSELDGSLSGGGDDALSRQESLSRRT